MKGNRLIWRPRSCCSRWRPCAFIPGGAKQNFEVANEFVLEPIIKLPAIGPFDLSIDKAVIYLWLATAIIVVVAIVIARALKTQPGRFQYAIEALYELARDGIVGSVMKSGQETWFPYIGAAFFFVLVSNLIGLIPLPFGEHHQFAYYAATANLIVTVTLALFTFVFTHYAGIRATACTTSSTGPRPARRRCSSRSSGSSTP